MLTTIGLSIVCLAWVFLLILMIVKKTKNISSLFVIIYAVGVLLLVIDGFNFGMVAVAWLNLISLFLAVAVLISLKNR